VALSDVAKEEIIYIRKLIEEISFSFFVKEATPIFCNQNAIILCKENVTTQRSKHIDIRFHFSRETQERKLMSCIFLQRKMSDIFTKPLVKDKHMKCIKGLNLDYSTMSIDARTN